MDNKGKIYGFDYLKILASSLLVLHHYQQVFNCSFSGINFFGGKIFFGYLVELFFTISGFLTLYSDKKCFRRGRLLHKFLRVYPMVFVSILICLLLKTLLSLVTADGQLTTLWNVYVLIANFGLLFAGYPFFHMIGINNPVWYVCILIQCYVIYYAYELILKKRGVKNKDQWRSFFYISLIVSSLIAFRFEVLNESSFRGWSSFSIGILIYIVDDYLHRKHFINDENIKTLGVMFCLLSIFMNGAIFLGMSQRWVLQFLVYPTLVFGIINMPIAGNDAVSSTGNISFSLYVFHYPIMVFMKLVLEIIGETFIHSYITMINFLVVAWMISWLLTDYVYLPIQRKIEVFEKKYE